MPTGFKYLSDEVKPRERMLAAGDARGLAGYELLAILLKTGSSGCDVLELSRRLLSAFGSVETMIRSDLLSFTKTVADWNQSHPTRKIRGIGRVKTLELLAAFEFVRRGCRSADICDMQSIDDVAGLMFDTLGNDTTQEHFLIVPLDSRNKALRRPERITTGLQSAALADAREVFSRCLKWGAAAVVIAHNHPDGNVTPSAEDVALTHRLAEAGRIVGVEVADHLILGRCPLFTSMRDAGLMEG